MSHSTPILHELAESLRTLMPNIKILERISKRGVPHLVIFLGRNYSIAYFINTQTYRVFYPWPTYGTVQEKRDFKTSEEVCGFFQEVVKQMFVKPKEEVK